ncbi:class I SAM-dependent methyltransferase [Paenibacillus albus]|uniref:Methyltransferase domain-containing protein n=1 Tax=Paenibacillus albus TaxID=2495582 RepID=A0A3S9AB88_9BACL|nr:class I SAM-dependent methyltransferase [Paenibacillus albus]AZN42961.1 methyltransferase domain-containing protein [Paenibacillus albus]
MGFLSVLSMAHKLVKERAAIGDTVIDATCGNGIDTQFLCELVGPRGTVYAFDIQAEALERTRLRLLGGREAESDEVMADRMAKLQLVHASHAEMDKQVAADAHGKVAAVMFNLGYLPGADQSVITTTEGTIAALAAAIALLRKGGILTVVLYPGHPGGAEEADAVTRFASELPQQLAQAVLYRMAQKAEAPYLLAIEKR